MAERFLIVLVFCLLLSSCSFYRGYNELESLFDNKSAKLSALDSKGGQCRPGSAFGACSHLWPAPEGQSKLPELELQVTQEVRHELELYLKGNGIFVRRALVNRDPYYPLLIEIFDDEGIPRDLINLALIESAFRAQAVSRSGAVGMWQFTCATAQSYGLKTAVRQDQRKDVVHSTLAAARHLNDLYRQYDDWYFALAAYNAGSGAVSRAQRGSPGTDFWAAVRSGRFSRQTARFVPRFIAATILVKTIERFGYANLRENVMLSISPSRQEMSSRQFAFMVEGDGAGERTKNWPRSGFSSAG